MSKKDSVSVTRASEKLLGSEVISEASPRRKDDRVINSMDPQARTSIIKTVKNLRKSKKMLVSLYFVK